jgi:hypothetical protein
MFARVTIIESSSSAARSSSRRRGLGSCRTISPAGCFDQILLMMYSAPTGVHHDYLEALTTNPPLLSHCDSWRATTGIVDDTCGTCGDGAKSPLAAQAPEVQSRSCATGSRSRRLPLTRGPMHARRLPAGGDQILDPGEDIGASRTTRP